MNIANGCQQLSIIDHGLACKPPLKKMAHSVMANVEAGGGHHVDTFETRRSTNDPVIAPRQAAIFLFCSCRPIGRKNALSLTLRPIRADRETVEHRGQIEKMDSQVPRSILMRWRRKKRKGGSLEGERIFGHAERHEKREGTTRSLPRRARKSDCPFFSLLLSTAWRRRGCGCRFARDRDAPHRLPCGWRKAACRKSRCPSWRVAEG